VRWCGQREKENLADSARVSVIEKSRRRICCPQKGGERGRRNCRVWGVYQDRRVRRGRKFEI